jgi:hypothetical protein
MSEAGGASRLWRAWAALCLAAGVVVAPLFLEVFSGGAPTRFLALPLRYAWAILLVHPILRAGWFPARVLGVAVALFTVALSAAVLADLAGLIFIHPGAILALEWWQRGLYPWVELLPNVWILDRPSYLWIVAVWNAVEDAVVGHLLFWHVPPRAQP